MRLVTPLPFVLLLLGSWSGRAAANANEIAAAVPDGAELVVFVPNIGDLLDRGMAFVKAAHLGGKFEKLTKDEILAELRDDGELPHLDERSGLVMIVRRDRQLLLAYRVTDNQFLKEPKFKSDDGLFVLASGASDHLFGLKGDVLVIGEDSDAVKDALRGGSEFSSWLAQQPAAFKSDCQVVLRVRITAWRDLIQGALTLGERTLAMGMAQAPEMGNAANVGFWRWAMDSIRSVVADAETYTASLRIERDILHFQDRIEFLPDSSAGAYLQSFRRHDQPLLRGLPDVPNTFCYYGCEWETGGAKASLVGDFFKSMMEAIEDDAEMPREELTKVMRLSEEIFRAISGFNGLVAPSEGKDGLIFLGTHFTDNPGLVIENSRKTNELSPRIFAAFAAGGGGEATREVREIAGKQVDSFSIPFDTQDVQLRRALEALYGREMTMLMAETKYGVASVMGARSETQRVMEMQLAAGAQAQDSPRVVEALNRISPKPQIVCLVDLPAAMNVMLDVAQQMGAPPMNFPPPPQPGAFCVAGFYVDGATTRTEIVIPAAPVRIARDSIARMKGEPVGD